MREMTYNKKIFMITASLYTVGALAGGFAYAGGLPSGGEVVDGNAHIYQRGSTLNIDQNTDKAIVNWNSFSVGKDNTVNFNQPSSDSATLNRVTGDLTSEVAGRINANGSVFLVNPNGILITADGVVDTGNFVASTLDIDNNDFLNGDYTFTKSGQNGVVSNRGTVSVDDGGFVALLGGAVKNDGTVRAHVGTVGFAGGEKIVMSFGNNDFLRVEVPTDKWEQLTDSQGNKVSATLDLGGKIESRGGFVDIAVADASDILRQSISISGIVSANTVSSTDGVISISGGTLGIAGNGRITADADYGNAGRIDVAVQSLNMSAPMSATAETGNGGTIKVSLQHGASLSRGAVLNASGKQGGSVSVIGGLSGDKYYKLVGSGDFVADSSDGTGGYINISNKNGLVGLFSGSISAKGTTMGGRIRIGGAFQGGSYNAKTSQLDKKAQDLFINRWSDSSGLVSAGKTSLGTGVHIDASSASGAGGTVVLWADHTTNNYAQITAIGATGGGAVEISGKEKVDSFGLKRVEVGNGVLLLDPKNVVIGKFADGLSQAKRIMSTTPLVSPFKLDDNDNFGISVAISEDGTKLAVGATGDDTGASNNGAVYLFKVDGKGSQWGNTLMQDYKIAYASGFYVKQSNAQFGTSVAFNDDGTKLVVGMPFVKKVSSYRNGKGRIFMFSVRWGKGVYRTAELEYGGNGYFGTGVALSDDGTKLAVGETHDNGGNKDDAGSVSLFVLSGDGNNWGTSPNRWRTGRIVHNVGGLKLSAHDAFGYSVALSGDGATLAVGAVGDDTEASYSACVSCVGTQSNAGAVYLFSVGGDRWGKTVTKTAKIDDTLDWVYNGLRLNAYDNFGSSVALSDDGKKLAVGAKYSDIGGKNRGAIYLFTISGSKPTFRTKITSSSVSIPDKSAFGSAVALTPDGAKMVVGAAESSSGGTERGAVYLLNANWSSESVTTKHIITHQDTLDLTHSLYFGASVALSSDASKLAISAYDKNADGGMVYLFEINIRNSIWGTNVIYTRRIGNDSGITLSNGDEFGYSVALSGDGTKLAVGATGTESGAGVVYLFTIGGNQWGNIVTEKKTVVESSRSKIGFGSSVALNNDGSKLAVGATGDNTGISNAGAVYLFTIAGSSTTWGSGVSQTKKIANGIAQLSLSYYEHFGSSVALSADGGRLAVGAVYNDTGATNAGAIYLFTVSGSTWGSAVVQVAKVADGLGVSLHPNDYFGRSVSLSSDGSKLVVGADGRDTKNGYDHAYNRKDGAVYLFSVGGSTWGQTVTQTGMITHRTSVSSDKEYFGDSVALNGDGSKLVVSATCAYNCKGGVSMFTVDGSTWGNTVNRTNGIFDKKDLILAKNETFGSAVAISDDGTKLAVGAQFNDTGGTDRGAVYLFDLNGDDVYYTAKIADGNGVSLDNGDKFGAAVALNNDGSTLVVGAPNDHTNGTNFGAVYVLSVGGVAWGDTVAQLGKLASNTAGNFGDAVAVSGDGTKLAVGIPKNNAGGTRRGAVRLYTIENSGNTYSFKPQATYTHGSVLETTTLYLKNSEQFGYSVALSGDGSKLAVGAIGYDGYRGRVYLFALKGKDTSWGITPKKVGEIRHGDAGISLSRTDYFGGAVALSKDGNKLAVGAHGDDTGGRSYGAVYIFSVGGSAWGNTITKNYKIAHDSGVSLAPSGQFGWALALSGDGKNLVVGAPRTNGALVNEGAIYLLNLSKDTVSPITDKLKKGTNIHIVASNDITVDDDIVTTAGAGKLTLIAGRSIKINSDVKINGGLTLTANDASDSSFVLSDRDTARAEITVAAGKTVSGGSGDLLIEMRTGNSSAPISTKQTGKITVWKADGARVSIVHLGAVDAHNDAEIVIRSGGQITATGDHDKGDVVIELAAERFTNNSDSNALKIADSNGDKGRYLIWTLSSADTHLNGIAYDFSKGNVTYDSAKGNFQANPITASDGNNEKYKSGVLYRVRDSRQSRLGYDGSSSKTKSTLTLSDSGSSSGSGAVNSGTILLGASAILLGGSAIAATSVASVDNIFTTGIYAHLGGIDMQAIYQPSVQAVKPLWASVFNTPQAAPLKYKVKYTTTYDMAFLANNIKAQKVMPLYEMDEKLYETMKRIFVQQSAPTHKTAAIDTEDTAPA